MPLPKRLQGQDNKPTTSPDRPPSQEPVNIRLAHVPGAQGDNCLLGQRGVEQLPRDSWPSLLISYVYLDGFLANQQRFAYRDWVLDSGAFSAYNSGMEIKLQDYIDTAKRLLSSDPSLVEVFALDVIGDWQASLRNAEEMWRQGVNAIPTSHYGEPWDVLKGLAKDYPKIGIGGCVGKRDKEKFAGQCFARVWPKAMHGFNFASEKAVLGHPWHSVDSTDWEIKPCKFGHWRAFGHQGGTSYMNWKGSAQNLRAEVEWYLALERKARERWRKEMEQLNETLPFTLRLVTGTGRSVRSDNPTFDREQWQ